MFECNENVEQTQRFCFDKCRNFVPKSMYNGRPKIHKNARNIILHGCLQSRWIENYQIITHGAHVWLQRQLFRHPTWKLHSISLMDRHSEAIFRKLSFRSAVAMRKLLVVEQRVYQRNMNNERHSSMRHETRISYIVSRYAIEHGLVSKGGKGHVGGS